MAVMIRTHYQKVVQTKLAVHHSNSSLQKDLDFRIHFLARFKLVKKINLSLEWRKQICHRLILPNQTM